MFKALRRISLSLLCGFAAQAEPVADIQTWLKREIIGPNLALAEVQAWAESRVPLMPAVQTAADWQKLADRMRRDTLDQVVFRGEAAKWRAAKTKVVWLETIEGGPGYRIRKLRYEAVPGLWIPALLYEPERLSGKVPVSLNVNGHEGIGKSVPYKQIRCINQAKRGLLVLNPEWIGMGQLNGSDYQHSKMNQLDLCGTSGVSPFYQAMARGLDVLLAHPNADPKRVAVSGLSGGGWQTIFISSLDARVTLCNPVAGYSSFRTRARFLDDLGDSEQTPCDLGVVTDYALLTALLAPRPALLTFNARDNCCFSAEHALPPLLEAALPIYKLYGRERSLRAHVNYDPGDHNYGPDNRQAFYRMLGDFFYPDEPAFNDIEIPCEAEVKAHTNLFVSLPSNNATFNRLALVLSQGLPRQPKLPTKRADAEKWQQASRVTLREITRARHSQAVAERLGTDEKDGTQAGFWRIKVDDAWTVPAVELSRGQPRETVILVSDAGRADAAAEAEQLLASGKRVLAVDPFYFGESKIRSHDYLFALLLASVGERPLGLQSGQLAAIARWSKSRHPNGSVTILALGPRSCTFSLVAAALEEEAIAGLELRGALGSLKEVIERNWGVDQKPELFCFGLLEAFDIKHLIAMVAPRPVRVVTLFGATASFNVTEMDGARSDWRELKAFCAALGGEPPLRE